MAEPGEQSPKPRIELPPLPADAIPIVPIRNVALFPGVVMPISLGRELSISAAQEAVRTGATGVTSTRPVSPKVSRQVSAR